MLAGKKITCFFLYAFSCVLSASGQYTFEKPVLISKEQGLPNNNVRSFQKGKDGFIWIASEKGLCRFDGGMIRVFPLTTNPDKPPFDNSVNAVLPLDNEVWMGTDQGISVMNCTDYSFRHYQFDDKGKSDTLFKRLNQQVSVLFADRKGNIFIGTANRGVCMYDKNKDDFIFFPFSRKEFPALFPSVGSDNTILSIEESNTNDSVIWAGTPAGLLEINKFSRHTRVFTFPKKDKDYQVSVNAFRRLYHHDDGLLYVGSWAAGVNVFDPATKNFIPLEVKNENVKNLLNKPIGKIYRKNDHEIWISTMGGLVLYDTKVKDVTWYKYNNSVENEFYAVDFIDDAGRIWHSDINGIQYFDPVMQQFARHSFKKLTGPDWGFAFYILSDHSGNNITVCPRQTDGLYRFNRITNEWTKFLFPRDQTFNAEKDAVRGFVQLPSGDFVISADRGIFLYSEKTKQISLYSKQLPFTLTRRGEVLLDHSGNLWISDDALGLIKWKPGTNAYKIYKTKDPYDDTIAFTGRLLNLFEDSHGNIWFQRLNGFGVYIAQIDSIRNFLYTKDNSNTFISVNKFAEDKKGRVWINDQSGNIGYGLSNSPERGIIYKLNDRDNIAPSDLPGLAADRNGDIWGCNSKELFKINAEDLSFTTYSFRYGVDEVEFFHFSFLPSGEMIFGGRNDIIIADPAGLKRNTEIPVPYIDQVEVFNQPLRFTMNGSPVRLTHKQNFFSVSFSAKAYTMAKEVRFRYRLKGFEEWKEETGSRLATYTNVPGGDYTFQLQAANNEGIWNDKMVEMPIHVGTAWWLTWWFRIGFLFFIGGLIYWFYRYRIEQVRKKEKLKSLYEKKLANVEMTALLAQMNPHFLFNSLNSIDSYIIRNESGKASEYLNNFARLMRLILQNSRSNYITLKDELETLDLYLQMEALRFSNKFEYEIKVDDSMDASSIVIPPMLIQPYVENAIWHGLMHLPDRQAGKKEGAPGKVEICISCKNNDLVCIIRDNGIGREKAAEIKAKKPGTHKRSMGMQITSDRMEMINKLYDTNTSVEVTDLKDDRGEPSGTEVKLVIPF